MVKLIVNGTARSYDGDPDMPLLWYVRDDLRLTGTRFGCGAGLCGACSVHVDGKAVRSTGSDGTSTHWPVTSYFQPW